MPSDTANSILGFAALTGGIAQKVKGSLIDGNLTEAYKICISNKLLSPEASITEKDIEEFQDAAMGSASLKEVARKLERG